MRTLHLLKLPDILLANDSRESRSDGQIKASTNETEADE